MMGGRWKSGRPREPSEHGIDVDEVEVTARKTTTLADDLGSRQSGRLKQDGGRLRDGSAEGPSGGGRRFRQRRQQGSPEKAAETFGEADTAEVCDSGTLEERHVAPAADVGADVTARRETTLADELGVEPSGRLKQGASRQHSVLADGGSPTRTKGRRLQGQPQRLRAESAEGAAATVETGGKACGAPAHAGKLRPSKAARHALRFAEDAVAVAGSSVMNENDGDVSEDAVREGGRRLAPAGRRALPRSRRASGAGRKAPVGPDGAVKATGAGTAPPPASARLRDAPSSSTAPAGEPGAVRKTPGATGNGGGIHGFWRRGRWKKAARAEAAARKAATTGEAGTLQGIVAVKARLRRMFTAGGAGRAGIALAATAALAVMFAASALSTCATLATGIADAMAATSYMAEDADIRGADEAYTRMEAALEGEAQAGESSHPGYDEYRYQIGELGHDPYALASILTARYGDYEASQVTGFLQEILDAQYSLTFEESSETETVTAIDPATGEESVQETVRRILTVRLVNRGLDYAARQVLTEGELASYGATYATKGNREDLFPEPHAGNYGSTGAGFDWRPTGEAMSDEKFAAMYAEGSKYLGWPYVWGGGSPETGFDCSGFVSWVLTASGVANTGRQITDGLLSYCTQVSREQARAGDLVFFTGTYETDLLTSHVGIYLGDGMMMHCGDPIQITSIDTPYWQAHLYGFGRIS